MWMDQVTYESCMTGIYIYIYIYMYIYCDIGLCIWYNGICEWVKSRMNLVWLGHITRMNYGTYDWVVSHMNLLANYLSHVPCEWVVAHVNESCHIWMRHGTCEWVVSHMNESCHIGMSRPTGVALGDAGATELALHMIESCHIWHVWHDSFICDMTCGTTRLFVTLLNHVRHDSFTRDMIESCHINESSHRCCVGWCGS